MTTDSSGPQAGDNGTAGVIARPPLLFLAALLLGFVADRFVPLPIADRAPASWIVGGVLSLAGLAVAGAGIRNFLRSGTPVPTNEPTRALVTDGIHGWTRNPIYAGMFVIYAGIGIAAQNPWILLLMLPLLLVIRYGVVAREETYLERRFGEPYRGYKARVRRWL
jgi:protein-S-isoprenylcysteine O-methyltransferase Ste14